MEKERSRAKPLSPHAEDCLELRREAQRLLLARLRREDGPQRFHSPKVSQEEVAMAAGMSVESLQKLEGGKTLLTEEMRARLIVAYGLDASEWASRESDILIWLERRGYTHRQREFFFVAEKRPRYGGDPASDEG
jgi:transcriptional regulator with XRE-family HTH domain